MQNKLLAVLLSAAVIAANVTPVPVFAASQTESVSVEATEAVEQKEEAPNGAVAEQPEAEEQPETTAEPAAGQQENAGEDVKRYVSLQNKNITYTYDETTKTLTIESSAEGEKIPDRYVENVIHSHGWENFSEKTEILVIKEGITEIGSGAFERFENLRSVSLPEGITAIGDCAFESCDSLSEINLPNSLTAIGNYAFKLCGSLSKISLPNSLTAIGDHAFDWCSSLTGIELPDGVTTIGSGAFNSCNNLSKISLPESVISIGSSAFYNCESLSSINLPEGITTLGDAAFFNCKSLCEISLPKGLAAISKDTFESCEMLSSVSLPKGLTTIGDYAFAYCGNLSSISLPEGLTDIGAHVFYNCKNLSSVSFPKSLLNIGASAFSYCQNLSSISFPKSSLNIGAYAFSYCQNLSSVSLPEGLTSIETGTFEDCRNLSSVSLPKGLVTIGTGAFRTCESLSSIKLPEGLVSISDSAFFYCKGLQEITLPESLREIGKSAFSETGIRKVVCMSEHLVNISSMFPWNAEIIYIKRLGADEVTLSAVSYTYDGKQKTPAVTVKDGYKTLTENVDYTVTYVSGRRNVGTYQVVVELKGNYHGKISKTFKITPKKLTAAAVTLKTASYTYDGKQKTPAVTVKNGTTVLKKGTDYTVTYAAGRINAGTYKVTVQMKGNYTGKIEKTFKINPKKLTAAAVTLKTASYVYDGKQKTPIVTVKNGTTVLKKGTAYTVTYAAGRKNVGTYKVTVQMKGNYTGKIEKTFTINPKGTTLSTVTAQKKGFKATVKKQATQTTGYQIQYAANNKFTGAVTKTIKNTATTSLTATNLKGGQKYFVRVRTYKTVNGKTYYSGWSAAKSVTTKR